jgi:hypothetical protein
MKKTEKKEKKPAGSGNNNVRNQYPPFYNVVSGGVTIEWTDKLSEASAAFKESGAKPRQLWRIDGPSITLVNQVI